MHGASEGGSSVVLGGPCWPPSLSGVCHALCFDGTKDQIIWYGPSQERMVWVCMLGQVDSVEHCDKFWYWLQAKGINSNRSGIVNAIAEKVNTWIPGEDLVCLVESSVCRRTHGDRSSRGQRPAQGDGVEMGFQRWGSTAASVSHCLFRGEAWPLSEVASPFRSSARVPVRTGFLSPV